MHATPRVCMSCMHATCVHAVHAVRVRIAHARHVVSSVLHDARIDRAIAVLPRHHRLVHVTIACAAALGNRSRHRRASVMSDTERKSSTSQSSRHERASVTSESERKSPDSAAAQSGEESDPDFSELPAEDVKVSHTSAPRSALCSAASV